jgi:hypothetical protein
LQAIEDNKDLLKTKYNQAKALATAVNTSKAKMQELKTQIEHWRMQRSAACESQADKAFLKDLRRCNVLLPGLTTQASKLCAAGC